MWSLVGSDRRVSPVGLERVASEVEAEVERVLDDRIAADEEGTSPAVAAAAVAGLGTGSYSAVGIADLVGRVVVSSVAVVVTTAVEDEIAGGYSISVAYTVTSAWFGVLLEAAAVGASTLVWGTWFLMAVAMAHHSDLVSAALDPGLFARTAQALLVEGAEARHVHVTTMGVELHEVRAA
jgi:hypothetical protein